MEMSSASTEWVHIPVPTAPADVTTGAVQVAFLVRGADPDDDTTWVDAEWVDDADPATARVLVGSGVGAYVLPEGVWHPWLKIAGFDPEIPVLAVPGLVRIL